MSKDPIYVELPGNRDEVLRTLVKKNKTGLPVMRKEGEVAGFVTRQNIFEKPEETQLSILMKRDYPTIGPDMDSVEAAKIMWKDQLYHLPVVEDGQLVGIITPTDILKVIEKKSIQEPVQSFVRLPCVPLYENTPLNVAVAVMRLSNIYALPVLNDNARLTGIIADRDIFNLTMVDGSVAISDLGLGDDEDDWTWEGLRNVMKLYYEVSRVTLPTMMVKEIMIKEPVSIFNKTCVSEAARLMLRNDFGQLPIKNSEDRLESMIYELDIMAALF